jgi:hypothetical protein
VTAENFHDYLQQHLFTQGTFRANEKQFINKTTSLSTGFVAPHSTTRFAALNPVLADVEISATIIEDAALDR